MPPRSDIRAYPDRDALALAAAGHIVALLRSRNADRLSLALAGGGTPRPLYRLLATTLRDLVPWNRLHVFWGDERYVPHEHKASNYRMAAEAMLNQAPLPPDHIHAIPTTNTAPADAAAVYADELIRFFGDDEETTFDVTILGMGPDGHTASLFPGDAVLDAPTAWAAAIEAPSYMIPRTRITLTLPCLNRSRHVVMLAAGSDKQPALRQIASAPPSPLLPAARVQGQNSTVWFVDAALAAGV